MGFLDFLKGKEEKKIEQEEEIEPVKIKLEKVRQAVEESVSENLEKDRERAKDLYFRIREDFRKIKKLNSELEGKTFEKGEKIYAPVNMIKDNYVKKTLSLVSGMPAIQNMEYGEIKDFCAGTGKMLKEMKNIPPKQTILLSKYFKGETSRIIKTLKEIEENVKEMEGLLDGKTLWFTGKITSDIGKLLALKKRLSELNSQKEILSGKISELEEAIRKREGEIKEILKGKEYRDFVDLGEEIERMEKEKSGTEQEIREEISGIKRPLKKLDHFIQNNPGIGKEKRLAFGKLSHSPFKTLFQDQGDSLLVEALLKCRELDLKDNEKERVEELIKKTELGYISKLKDRYTYLENGIKEKNEKKRKSKVTEEKEKIERAIENLRHEISELKKEMEGIEKTKEETKENIYEQKRSLEEMIWNKRSMKFDIMV